MSRKPKETTCSDCNKPIIVPYSTFIFNRKHNRPIRCKECYSKYMSKLNKEKWENKTDEEKKKMLAGKDKYLSNLSEEERKAFYAKRAASIKKSWNNKPVDEMKQVAEIHKQIWANMDKNTYDSIQQKKSESAIVYWNSLSKEEKKVKSNKLASINKEWRDNLSEEDKQQISLRCKQRWDDMSDENKEKESIRLKEMAETYRNNMSEEDRLKIQKKKSFSAISYWNSLSDDIKKGKIHSLVRKKNNKFNERFELMFNNDKLNKHFYYKLENLTRNNSVVHSWDYGIYDENGNLQLLVDLDGAYFHADECDYDGMHSQEEYDERRGLSIPYGVKWCIINELKFDKCFEWMKKILSMNYDEFINETFRYLQSMPFPYPEYTDTELMKSYRDLCKLNCDDKYHKSLNVNTRIGDRLIQHFHRSIWHDSRFRKKSPYEAWNNDNTLYEMITNGYLYHSYLNKNKILQGFNIYEPCKRTQFISAGKAKMIIHKYLSEYDEIFDPFSGYGGIMLACIAMNKRYIGQDVSEIHVRESLNMVQFLKDNDIEMDISLGISDPSKTKGKYKCLFTIIPNDDRYIDICLKNYECEKYIFTMEETEKYQSKVIDSFNEYQLIIL